MISEERKEVNKQRIIEVSTNLFTKQGIQMTTIAQIAKEAGVVNRTVLNIFGTKDNLIIEDMSYISNMQMENLKKLISTREYKKLYGIEQIMFVLKDRGKLLKSNPELLLLLSEVKVWATRIFHDDKIIETYIENLNFLVDIMKRALNKGLKDKSINKMVDEEETLSFLVSSFRAVLQQLAHLQLNPEFNKYIYVDKELQSQINIIYEGLASSDFKRKNQGDKNERDK